MNLRYQNPTKNVKNKFIVRLLLRNKIDIDKKNTDVHIL